MRLLLPIRVACLILVAILFGSAHIAHADAATLGTTTTDNTSGLNLIDTNYCKLLPNSSAITINSIHAYNAYSGNPDGGTTGFALYEDNGTEYNRIYLTNGLDVVNGWNVQNVNLNVTSNILACVGQSSGSGGFILARSSDLSQGNIYLPHGGGYSNFEQTYPYNYVGNSNDPSIYVTYTSTSTSAQIVASPSSSAATVGSPFNVDIKVADGASPFNAARATVAVSSNLSITGVHNASSNACNLQYTQSPTTSNPSFAGAVFGGSSTGCTVYTLTLTPTSEGTGTITFTNGSVKAYSDNSEILTGVQNASFTLADGPTPTPTPTLDFTIASVLPTYNSSYTLLGTKLATLTHIFVNGSDTNSSYPTSTTWENTQSVSLGDNNFTLYGSDDESNQTATQTVTVSRHTLGDINGDGNVDLIDASLFAVDWDKTSDLTYNLSDMDGDGDVDLTDLSILAKLIE